MNVSRKVRYLPLMFLAGALVLLSIPTTSHAFDATQQLRKFIDRLNDGNARGDFDYAVSLQAPDGIRIHPIRGVIKGRKALRDYFEFISKHYTDPKETLTWVISDGNRAAAGITWDATVTKSGKHIIMPMALLCEFDDNGMITWSQIFFDYGRAEKAAK